MTRVLLCLLLAVAYLLVRVDTAAIVPVVRPASAPVEEIGAVARTMTRADRDAMAGAYEMFSRAVAADPSDDPVFPDTAALRRAHRGMLLSIWRGLLDNEPGKVPGLREAVEGAFDKRIGSDEVLLNPTLKQSVAKSLADIAASFK